MTMSLVEFAQHEHQVIDLRDRMPFINDKCAHAIEAFEGTRYSIVLYTQANYGKLSDEHVDTLKGKGYIWHDPEQNRLINIQQHQRTCYQRLREGKEQKCQSHAEMQRFVGEWMLTNKRLRGQQWLGVHKETHKVGA